MYITTRNQRVASRALQVVVKKLYEYAVERGIAFSTRKTVNIIFRKKNKEPMKIILRN